MPIKLMMTFFLFAGFSAQAKIYLPTPLSPLPEGKDQLTIVDDPAAKIRHRYLLKLKGLPALAQLPINKASTAEFRTLLKNMRAEKQLLKTKLISAFNGKHLKFLYDYNLAWNGMAIELETDGISLLGSIAEIEDAVPSVEYTIPEEAAANKLKNKHMDPPETMPPPLGIDSIWQTYGLTGKNITIAVFDTGIDYTHPDLGGCLGATCKVVGGYDIINNDNDPMDDHFHGTHVAGIAAGNGRKMGAAPNAKLYAYKVLSNFGSGSTEGILAALEMSLDPNGDGIFTDAPDVLNFSLGSPPTETISPLDEAINFYAASTNSVIAIAAGNSGLRRIGSPGSADAALTVAASIGGSERAPFSSVGPGQQFNMKPDVMAPGFDIWSSVPGAGYQALSGTSMATPLTAGVAALLSEKFGKKRADVVKKNLKFTAKSIVPMDANSEFRKFLYEGHGLIQTEAALNYQPALTFTGVTNLAPNLIEASNETFSRVWQSSWTYAAQPSAQEYTTSITHDLGEKIEVNFTPKIISVAAGVAGKVTVTVTARGTTMDVPRDGKLANGLGAILRLENKTTGEAFAVPLGVFIRARYDVMLEGFKRAGIASISPYDGGSFLAIDPKTGKASGTAMVFPHSQLREYYTGLVVEKRFPPAFEFGMYLSGTDVMRGVNRVIDDKALSHSKTFALADENARIVNPQTLFLRMNNILHFVLKPNYYKRYWFNDLTGFDPAPVLTLRQYGTNAMYMAASPLRFEAPTEDVVLPEEGYEHYDAHRTDYQPAMLCHHSYLEFGVGKFALVGRDMSLVDQVYIGKGEGFAKVAWGIDYFKELPSDCSQPASDSVELTGNLK